MEQTAAVEFKHVGTGTSVFPAAPVEGRVKWLDSPQAVIEFVASGDLAESVVVARGGTTTFLTPALTGGVKGVITLQGAPESHLGILSREYGIPCIMGVSFTEGMRSARGEIIPADGAVVRLDTSAKEGQVLIDPDAPVDDTPLAPPTDAEAAAAAAMEQIIPLLHNYLGQTPHGSEGDQQIRSSYQTDVLQITRESLGRHLTVPELNEQQAYMAWNIWDFLALRATEGESGLIPRQEYETFGCLWQWLRYGDFYRLILDKIGVDGLIEMGKTPRREPANKVNMLHIWCSGFTPMFGRAILGELGLANPDDARETVDLYLQFMRALYYGMWGASDGEAMFTSMRGYKGAILDRSWIDRFAAEARPFTGSDDRGLFTAFNASTELLGFLLHFDNRSGLCDSGPYDLGGGRFMIVRDHFLHDPMYHWHDVAEELPHCFTQAMIFNTHGAELTINLMDGGTVFTEPANYLEHLESVAVYARDSWDTPISELRPVDAAEMKRSLELCKTATDRLYRRIASMPKRDKIIAGAQVYYSEFVAPFARAAGVWETMRDELDFYELHPIVSEAYFPLVRDGQGQAIMGKVFVTGTGFPGFPEGTPEIEDGVDTTALKGIYDRFLAANQPFKSACFAWMDLDEDARWEKAAEFTTHVERVEPALNRTAELLPRFGGYGERLRAALARVDAGEHDYVTSVRVDSLHTVWMEIHEDYLQTLGIDREAEGSY